MKRQEEAQFVLRAISELRWKFFTPALYFFRSYNRKTVYFGVTLEITIGYYRQANILLIAIRNGKGHSVARTPLV